MLRFLFITGNCIKILHDFAFHGLANLKELSLNNEDIEYISPLAFRSLENVANIDISNNKLKKFDPHILQQMDSLQYLDVSSNYIAEIEEGYLVDYLKEIKADHSSKCCIARQVLRCTVHTQREQINCHSLLPSPLLRAAFWTIPLVIFTFNIIVIIARVAFRVAFQNILNIPLTNLAVADALFSIYFLSICIADAYTFGTYGIKSLLWEKSLFCRILSFSSSASTTVSLVTSVEVCVLYLLKFGNYAEATKEAVVLACISSWFVAALFTSIPLAIDIYLNLSEEDTCFGFKLGLSSGHGWKYSILPQFILSIVLILSFLVSSIKTGCIIIGSARKIKQHGNIFGKRNTTKTVGVLVVFFLSYLVSWIPVLTLMLFTMVGREIDKDIVTWLVVTTFTGNAITNPFLHTIRLLIFTKK